MRQLGHEHTMSGHSLDELDRKIIHALQIDPFVPWTLVGEVLGADAATVARRWRRLQADGCCWSAAYPGNALMALVEVDAEPSRIGAVAEGLAAVPQMVTVEKMAGDRDLLCTVMVPTVQELSHVLQRAVSSRTDVRSSRAQIVTHLFLEGSQWTIRALNDREANRIRSHGSVQPAPGPEGADAWTDLDRRIMAILSADVRISAAAVAAAAQIAPASARRRVALMRKRGMLTVRTEVARNLTTWPVSATFWATVDAHELPRAASIIRSLPEVRMCAAVTGQNNLVFQTWLQSTTDALRFESQLSKGIANLRVVDRAIALEQFKLMGRPIDSTGHARGPAISIVPSGAEPAPLQPAEAGAPADQALGAP